jgi:hypothetical protein
MESNMLQIRNLDSLAGSDLIWLKSKHHSALDGHNNAAHEPLASLLVLNEDEVKDVSKIVVTAIDDAEVVLVDAA